MNINIDVEETIRQAETLNHIFSNMGYVPPKPKKMYISEQQLDEIEDLLDQELTEQELENLWSSCRNLQGVLSSFRTRLTEAQTIIAEKTQ